MTGQLRGWPPPKDAVPMSPKTADVEIAQVRDLDIEYASVRQCRTDLDARHGRPDLIAGIQPVEKRHGDVGDHEVGLEPGDGLDEGSPVTNRLHHFEFSLQEVLQGFGHQGVVVGQQYSRSLHLPPIPNAPSTGPRLRSWCPGLAPTGCESFPVRAAGARAC